MEETIRSEFRKKVFDQRTFDFVLEVFQFLGACGAIDPAAKKISLDSFAFSNSLERSTQFFNALNSFSARDVRLNLNSLSKFTPPFELFSEELFDSFILTLRHLSVSERPVDLSSFFRALRFLLEKNRDVAEAFLKTVRALPPSMQGAGAHRLAQTVLNLPESQPNLASFFEALRHCSEYFRSEESFVGILKSLSQADSELYYEAFSLGQLESKKWLLDEAEKTLGNRWGRVFVLAGWMGVLPRMIFDRESMTTTAVRNFDLDGKATALSETLNSPQVVADWKFKSSCMDIRDLHFPHATYNVKRKDGSIAELGEIPDVIINTSCEHIENIQSWFESLPPEIPLILQSNDAFGLRDHHGCVESLEAFKAQLPLREILYAGSLDLGDYNRFMLIGRK